MGVLLLHWHQKVYAGGDLEGSGGQSIIRIFRGVAILIKRFVL